MGTHVSGLESTFTVISMSANSKETYVALKLCKDGLLRVCAKSFPLPRRPSRGSVERVSRSKSKNAADEAAAVARITI